ncbi:MAG: extracellular solute-binding protein [Christensenellales bacterium]|jgi:putative aldouronate transport system substrate-binding protein
MKRTIRTLALILTALLVVGMAACTSQSGGDATQPPAATKAPATAPTQAPTPEPTSSEPIVISFLMSGDNTPSSYNDVLREVQNRTGYIMDVTYVAGADYQTKLSAMIASKTLPDIFGFGASDGKEFKENGLILELTELLQNYGPDILADKGDHLDFGVNGGGDGIWGVIRNGNILYNNLSIRADWLDALDLDKPTDLDSLYNVLKAFTQDDPDQDGQDDTIGIGISMSTNTYSPIFGAFGIPVGRNIQLEDGTVTSWLRHPKFLDAIKYMRTLYQEGLMETEFATIPTMNSFEKLWNGIYGVYGWEAVGTTNNWLGRYTEDPKPTFDFLIIAGPGGPGGVPEPKPNAYWGIAASSEHPEDAMKLANYFTTEEGDELLYFGIEGVHYKWIDKQAGTFEYIPPYNDAATHRNAGGFVYWVYFVPTNHAQFRTYNPQTRAGQELAKQYLIPDATIYSPLEASIEYGDTLSSIVNEAFATLIVTKGDVEAEYQGFVERWLAEGGEVWQEEATRVYAEENPN